MKKSLKKGIAVVLALSLVFSLAVLTALADTDEETQASTGSDTYDSSTHVVSVTEDSVTTYYTSLADAYEAAASGATISLLSDISMSSVLTVTKTVTLDLNGKTISVSVGKAFTVSTSDVTLTIQDSSSDGSGTISSTTGNVLYIQAGTVVLTGGTVTAAAGYTANLTASSKTKDGARFTMTGGTLSNSKSTGTPLLISYGTAKITGGTIKNTTGANYGISVSSANASLAVGTSSSSGYTEGTDPYIGYLKLGKSTTGEYINLYSGLIVSFSGGSYLSSSATLTAYFGENTEELASGLSWASVSGTSYYKIEGGLSEETAAAKITSSAGGTEYYASAVSAAKNAQDGDTVTLLADYSGSDELAFAAGNVTLDLNGHSVSVSGDHAITFSLTGSGSSTYTVAVKNSSDTQAAVKSASSRITAYSISNTCSVEISGDNITFSTSEDTESAGTLALSGKARIAYSDSAAGYVWNGGLKVTDSDGVSWIYGTYKDAISVASDSTAVLLGDWTADETIVSGSVSGTLDLNGYTITSTVDADDSTTNSDSFIVYAGNNASPTMTIKNGSITNTGSISYGIYVAKDGSSLILDDVNLTVVLSEGSGAAIVTEGTTLDNTVTLQNGTNVKVVDTDGSFAGMGIYFPSTGTLTVSDSTVTALNSGIEIRAGSLVISGDDTKITATATSFEESANGSGSTVSGAAVVVSQHTTNYNVSATISGGTLTGYYALYEKDLQDTTVSGISLCVEDGTFISSANSSSIAAIYSQNCTAFIYHGTFTSSADTDVDASYLASTGKSGGTVTAITEDGSTQVHALNEIAASAADCENDGNIAYSACTACSELFTPSDESGETVYTQVSQSDVVISATGHTEGEAVTENEVAATCTTDGSYDTVVYCTVCGEEISRETITVAATGHSYEAVVTEPTCTEDGYTTYTCSVCGDTYTDDYTDATGHSYESEVTTEATCTEDGVLTYTCSVCGDAYTEAIEATGHTEGEAVVENEASATCTEDGSYDTVVYCTVCGEELSRETITVAATGHSYEAVVTEPTCTEEGYTTYTCSVCGDTYTSDYTDATGHSYESEVTTEATCTEDGVTTYTCSVCGDTYTEAIEATGHTAGEAVTENEASATCTEDGSYDTVVYCTVCGEEISRETITVEATGHSYEAVITEPTCTEGGYTTYTCSVCGDTYTDDYTDATGHSYEMTETVEATQTEDGYIVYTCSICGDTYTEIIEATGSSEGSVSESTQTSENVTAEASVDEEALAVSVLGSEAYEELISSGSDMDFTLVITDEDVSEDDTSLVEAYITSEYSVGLALDITLYCTITDAEGQTTEQITSTGDTSYTITLTIPEELVSTDSSVTRTYAVIRVHDGEAEEIASAYDEVANTLTFSADRFSTYAVVYADTSTASEETTEETTAEETTEETTEEKTTEEETTAEETTEEETTAEETTASSDSSEAATGDVNDLFLWICIAALAASGIAVLGIRRKFN